VLVDHQEDLSKRALINHLSDFEVLQFKYFFVMAEAKPCNKQLGFSTCVLDLLLFNNLCLLLLHLLFLPLNDDKIIVEIIIKIIELLFILTSSSI